jgi:hypothetical protein
LYLKYDFEPSLSAVPALDISVKHEWNSTEGLVKYGADGVYAAQPIGFKHSVSGYFGSQITSTSGALLFSIWDKGISRHPAANLTCGGPNATWCNHLHAFPLSSTCHRHCLDCGLHPGWHNTTGTQCSISRTFKDGDQILFRLFRSATNSTYDDNSTGFKRTLRGSEWTLTAAVSTRELRRSGTPANADVLGRMFFEGAFEGLDRFSAFHEHFGCTPCHAFYESEIRSGPWVASPSPRSPSISFTRTNSTAPDHCEAYEVDILPGPAAQFRTGPGTGPH